MLSLTQNTFLVVAILVACLTTLEVLNRLWAPNLRRRHNDLIGWELSILGTTYAVILGFMLYTVWTDYGAADLNADREANALTNLYRLGAGLPEPQHSALQHLALSYGDAVVRLEWPEMMAEQTPHETGALNSSMWQTLVSVRPTTASENTAQDHALSELQLLTEYRRMRLLQSGSHLPAVLWFVLIAGAAVTLFSACLFGATEQAVHRLQISSLGLLIALVLVAIADIDRPFQGSVHVDSQAFIQSLDNMRQQH